MGYLLWVYTRSCLITKTPRRNEMSLWGQLVDVFRTLNWHAIGVDLGEIKMNV